MVSRFSSLSKSTTDPAATPVALPSWEDSLTHVPLSAAAMQELLVCLAALVQAQLRAGNTVLAAQGLTPTVMKQMRLVRCETGFWSETPAGECPCYLFIRLPHTAGVLLEPQSQNKLILSRATKIGPRSGRAEDDSTTSGNTPLIVRQPGEQVFHVLSPQVLRTPEGDTLTRDHFVSLLVGLLGQILHES